MMMKDPMKMFELMSRFMMQLIRARATATKLQHVERVIITSLMRYERVPLKWCIAEARGMEGIGEIRTQKKPGLRPGFLCFLSKLP